MYWLLCVFLSNLQRCGHINKTVSLSVIEVVYTMYCSRELLGFTMAYGELCILILVIENVTELKKWTVEVCNNIVHYSICSSDSKEIFYNMQKWYLIKQLYRATHLLRIQNYFLICLTIFEFQFLLTSLSSTTTTEANVPAVWRSSIRDQK